MKEMNEIFNERYTYPLLFSVSQRQYKGDMLVQRRMKKRPLLRSEGHDSEEEWREHLREIKSDSSGINITEILINSNAQCFHICFFAKDKGPNLVCAFMQSAAVYPTRKRKI